MIDWRAPEEQQWHLCLRLVLQVPLDGTITYGKALVSAEHITGESLPVLRRPGDEIAAGSLNRDGLLVVKATRLAEESTPARIAKLTLDAQVGAGTCIVTVTCRSRTPNWGLGGGSERAGSCSAGLH